MLAFDTADFTFYTPLYPAFELGVLGFSGREAISEPFRIEIELVSELLEISPADLIGQPAVLTIRGQAGVRYLRGILSGFQLVLTGRKLHHYKAWLVPGIAAMTYAVRSRIFQRKSVKDIVTEVLKINGLPGDMSIDYCQESYSPRDYCVQYRESDLAFISRLMEEEGIFYYFEHSFEKEILVLGDSLEACDALALSPCIDFQDESRAAALSTEYLQKVSSGQSMTSGRVALRDFTFKQPDLDMNVSASADTNTDLEVYDYPGEYISTDVGMRLARVKLETLQCAAHSVSASGTTRALVPGSRFTLEKHPRADLNREYLILSVSHSAKQPGVLEEEEGAAQVEQTRYSCELRCLPTDIPFRAAQRTPRPVLGGVQSATVVGPGGEEIYCDEYGRVKVQFHWDRDGRRNEQSSCWIRVSQTWAGAAFGTIFVPRVGEEVLVQFLEGDPDRPVIIGRVYNGLNPAPYPLPEHRTQLAIRTRSTPRSSGFNELRFQDRAGSEEIALHAQRDLNEIVLRNHEVRVDGIEAISVGGSQTLKIGDFQTIDVKKAISISSSEGEIRISSPTRILLEVGESRIIMTPSKVRIEAPEINTSALGINNIFGGLVKINCEDPAADSGGSEAESVGVSIQLTRTNQAGQSSWAHKSVEYQAFLKRLAQSLTPPELKKALDKLPESSTFLAYLKQHFPKTLAGLKDLLETAFKDFRLPTLEELKKLGAGAFAEEIGKLLGDAVLEALPEDWDEALRKDLARLVQDGATKAIETAINEPEKLKQWAEEFAESAAKSISGHLGRMAGEEVKEWLAPAPGEEQSWLEQKTQQVLPEAVEKSVSKGTLAIFDMILD